MNLENYVHRVIEKDVIGHIADISLNRAAVVYGPRRVGKTCLCRYVVEKSGLLPYLYINGDEFKYHDFFASLDSVKISSLLTGYKLIVIDEAQRIPNIGMGLKLIVDSMKDIRVLVTGSSSLSLSGKLGEPLTGRKFVYVLYPFSLEEIRQLYDPFTLDSFLREVILTFGLYPEVVLARNNGERKKILLELVSSYVLKDVLELEEIRYPEKLRRLLQLLAYQVGQLVSVSELAANLGISKTAVERYLYLLEESFVIFRLYGFSRNLRNEIKKMPKIYFWDIGIRNALIEDFRPIELRNDLGQLWENFVMVERVKYLKAHQIYSNLYFWRLHTGAEVDLVEERDGRLYGFEIKVKEKERKKNKNSWLRNYPGSEYRFITMKNYMQSLYSL